MGRHALLSCFDKSGVSEFASSLVRMGWVLHASGGTAEYLGAAGLSVEPTENITGIVSLLGGRVKTLHPDLYSAILAAGEDREEMRRQGRPLIDLVAVDFYPFGDVAGLPPDDGRLAELIDIGGPSLVRAAAKNWRHVIVAPGAWSFPHVVEILEKGLDDDDWRRGMAARAFDATSRYDLGISTSLERGLSPGLRYGENPHQAACVHFSSPAVGFGAARLLVGESLSYNNYLDADAAWDLARDLSRRGVAAVLLKHGNPCGAGLGGSPLEAFEAAWRADMVSPYGGVLAVSSEVDGPLASRLKGLFLELLIAPGFSGEALEILSKRRKMRVMAVPGGFEQKARIRSIWGAVLVQEPDTSTAGELPGEVKTRRHPTPGEMEALEIGWTICRSVKSNAIVVSDGAGALGVGAGQMNRVESLELALKRIGRAGLDARGAVMASDGFLPFRDCVDMAAGAGITAIVQPGGSIRDAESIAAADDANIAMIFTGRRHFRH
ncbi:bifunctional phosphoribosylaminoimidazolecarboxamide formyltransferase/IMP cyclohydrolase [Candidatus Fermentibacteria bacterium]|nr:bifunctional phosphoribosylaminoimidazolecarboxamide formyltransferase/IMP cyclohydrolase [Candidatus Fermentibacteria bacterium]